jgi:hypothetical protein
MTAKVTWGDEVVPVVWIIDPDQWPRAMLRAELIERGVDAVGLPETLRRPVWIGEIADAVRAASS